MCLFYVRSDACAHDPPHTARWSNTLIKMALAGETECFAVLMDRHIGALKRCIGSMVRNRPTRTTLSGCPIESLAPSVDIPVGSQLSHVDDPRRHQRGVAELSTGTAQSTGSDTWRLRGPGFHGRISASLLYSSEATTAVRNALARLPERYREVLILRDLSN